MHPPRAPSSPAQQQAHRKAYTRIVERYGPGAWVAVAGEQGDEVVGSGRVQHTNGMPAPFAKPARVIKKKVCTNLPRQSGETTSGSGSSTTGTWSVLRLLSDPNFGEQGWQRSAISSSAPDGAAVVTGPPASG